MRPALLRHHLERCGALVYDRYTTVTLPVVRRLLRCPGTMLRGSDARRDGGGGATYCYVIYVPLRSVKCRYVSLRSVRAVTRRTWGANQPANRPSRLHDSWANGFGRTECGLACSTVAFGEVHTLLLTRDGQIW